jgi:ribosome-associated toxin RatA of RatAB toxin-antitoxin module
MARDGTPVKREYRFPSKTLAQVFDVIADYAAYADIFAEVESSKILESDGDRTRVAYTAKLMMPVRYTLDMVAKRDQGEVSWSLVDSNIIKKNTGAWRLRQDGNDVVADYTIDMQVDAPVPGFVLKKVLDGLVGASLPAMFAAVDKAAARRGGA